MEFKTIRIEKPSGTNLVLGQTRSAKTIEDIHDALLRLAAEFAFGIAFCEASGQRLVRCAGTDEAMIELARKNAAAVGAGDAFFVFFGSVPPPRDVLAAIKPLPEVCGIYCATANPLEVVLATTDQGCGIVSVIDGFGPKGVESDEDTTWREDYLRHVAGFGKLGVYASSVNPLQKEPLAH